MRYLAERGSGRSNVTNFASIAVSYSKVHHGCSIQRIQSSGTVSNADICLTRKAPWCFIYDGMQHIERDAHTSRVKHLRPCAPQIEGACYRAQRGQRKYGPPKIGTMHLRWASNFELADRDNVFENTRGEPQAPTMPSQTHQEEKHTAPTAANIIPPRTIPIEMVAPIRCGMLAQMEVAIENETRVAVGGLTRDPNMWCRLFRRYSWSLKHRCSFSVAWVRLLFLCVPVPPLFHWVHRMPVVHSC